MKQEIQGLNKEYVLEEKSEEFLRLKTVEAEIKIIESLFEFNNDEFNNLYDNEEAREALLAYVKDLIAEYKEKEFQ